jgi:hypothetical protein
MSGFSKAPGQRRRAATSRFASWASRNPPATQTANSLPADGWTQDEMSGPASFLDSDFRLIEEARAGGLGWVQSATELRPPLDLPA